MKQFKDLVKGDVIYYYSHSKMHPKKVVRIEFEEVKPQYNWQRSYTVLVVYCETGRPLRLYTYDGKICQIGCGWTQVFSCREAAQMELDRLKNNRQCEINYQTQRINRYKKYLEKYGFAK